MADLQIAVLTEGDLEMLEMAARPGVLYLDYEPEE